MDGILIHPFVLAGLLAFVPLSITLAILLAANWIAANRRFDALLDRHTAERDMWIRERGEMWRALDELKGAIVARRTAAKR